MKKFFMVSLVSMFSILGVVALSSCSKEDAAAKKVDVSARIEALKSGDSEARENACIELAKAGPRAAPAVAALIPLLKDNDVEIGRLAAYALGEFGSQAKAALQALAELDNDTDRLVGKRVEDYLSGHDA